jgi:ATP-dependent Zn protease
VLGIGQPVTLSIGQNGGLTETQPGEPRALTRGNLEAYLIMLLAGRAAEEIVSPGMPT